MIKILCMKFNKFLSAGKLEKIVGILNEIFLRVKKMEVEKIIGEKILGAGGWNADDHLLLNYI